MNTQKTFNYTNAYSAQEIIEIGLNNTQTRDNYQDLGILKFLKLVFPERFYNDFGELHYDMARIFLDLFNPKRERRIDKQGYFLVHREAAKSTLASFGFVMWCLLLNGRTAFVRKDYSKPLSSDNIEEIKISEKFIMIVSETSGSAEDFVSSIKEQLDSRKDLAEIFGEKSPQYVADNEERAKDKKWTKTIFKTADGIYVRGLGSGQQVRGRNMGGSRPTLCIVDDMYSENNTKTIESREKIDKWFNASLLNSLDSVSGKCLWLGTLVHPDIVVKDMKKSDNWFGIDKPIISPEELQNLISICKTDNGFKIDKELLKSKQHEFKTLSWSNRHNLSYIASIYKDNAIDKDNADYFYQEFMNQPIAPESIAIKEDTFKGVDFTISNKGGYTFVSFYEDDIEWLGPCELYIGVDMAATIRDTSDRTVIMCAGYARVYPRYQGKSFEYGLDKYKNGKVIPVILDCSYGRMDIFEYMDRPGVFEECYKMQQKYNVRGIIIEANGQQEMSIREIEKRFNEKNVYGAIIPEYVHENKKERINAILRPIIQRHQHFYCQKGNYIEKLYMETLLLGIGDHDDFPDALEECYKHRPEAPRVYPEIFADYQEKEFRPTVKHWYTGKPIQAKNRLA